MPAVFPANISAEDFHIGEVVRKFSQVQEDLSACIGRVVGTDVKAQRVWVQWPWSVQSEDPTYLVPVGSGLFSVYSSTGLLASDVKQPNTKVASSFATKVASAIKVAIEEYNRGSSREFVARLLAGSFGSKLSKDLISNIVNDLFEVSNREIRLASVDTSKVPEFSCRKCGECLHCKSASAKYVVCPTCSFTMRQ